jgi:hypothetical protein
MMPVVAKSGRRLFATSAAVLISCLGYGAAYSNAIAQEEKSLDRFVWAEDKSTDLEFAVSRSNPSFNFFDIGDLAPYSRDLVKKDLTKISKAAGEAIDTNLSPSIAIIHDTNVFSRLKSDRHSFAILGIPDSVVERLLSRTGDSSKCLTMSLADSQNDIYLTIILLSEESNSCLVGGLLEAFGVRALDVDTQTLMDICILYEGRRRGIRDRLSLSQEASGLRDACVAKAKEEK